MTPSAPANDDLGFGPTLRGFQAGQRVFRRYQLQRMLGRGGMGVVWLAEDLELDRPVAMKFLPETVMLDRQALEDLKHETKRALQLNHHHIVRIHDFHHDDSLAGISMEYVDGNNLTHLRFERQPTVFNTGDIAEWVQQLCDALAYAHERARIVHRDLKPANLMVNQRSELKVADFGIARSLSDSVSRLSQRSSTSGTLVYMSPQQLDGEPPNVRDDIYSIGATVYELLTGRPPFYSGNLDRQIREKVPPTIQERRRELDVRNAELVPEAWEMTVARCLAKDPSQRPGNAKDLSAMFRGDSPAASAPTDGTGTTRIQKADETNAPRKGGRTLVVATLVFVALALALGGGWAVWHWAWELPAENRRVELRRQEIEQQQVEQTKRAEQENLRLANEAKAQAGAEARAKQEMEAKAKALAEAERRRVELEQEQARRKAEQEEAARRTAQPVPQTNVSAGSASGSVSGEAGSASEPTTPAAPETRTITPTKPYDPERVPTDASAFTLVKLGNEQLPEQLRDKVLEIRSEKSQGTALPTVWQVDYSGGAKVKFRSGKVVGVDKGGRDPFAGVGRVFGIRQREPFAPSKLRLDSDRAVEIALKQRGMEHVVMASSEIQLRYEDGLPVWWIKLWARHPREPQDEIHLGEILLTTDDGRVLEDDLHPERIPR